jgi:amidohydrolase
MLNQAQAIKEELIRLRRDIHQHPELSFQEFRTAQLVADTLAELGIEAQTGIGRTGVVAHIGPGDGPVIGIRADMDALPIRQKNDVPYRSQNEGVMHACGHDAHTAMLLGVAHLLPQKYIQDQAAWRGRVRLLFQPSEEAFDENGISGATAMIEDGALEGLDSVIALHVASHRPAAQLFFQDEYSLAAVDSFKAWVRGDGGHGAFPHRGSDPLFMLGPILNAIYAIPSRQINPLRSSVVSLGQISAGAAPNVIPNEVYIQGTIRSHDEETRSQLAAAIERALSLSETMGGSYELQVNRGYPSLYNDPTVNGWMREVTADLLGEETAVTAEFGMGAEDFAYMARQSRGAMFMLGAAIDDGLLRHHHTDIFDIDEDVLPLGTAVLAETAYRFVRGQYND